MCCKKKDFNDWVKIITKNYILMYITDKNIYFSIILNENSD